MIYDILIRFVLASTKTSNVETVRPNEDISVLHFPPNSEDRRRNVLSGGTQLRALCFYQSKEIEQKT